MQTSRIDRIARTLAAGAGRRRVLGGLLAAAFEVPAAAAATTPTAGATPGPGGAPMWLYLQAFRVGHPGP